MRDEELLQNQLDHTMTLKKYKAGGAPDGRLENLSLIRDAFNFDKRPNFMYG